VIEEKSDLVLRNGSIYTVDKKKPWAQAVAITDSKIVFVGSDADAAAYIDADTNVINLDGMMVLPAFVDSHMHPASSAYLYKYQLSLFDLNEEDLIQAYLSTVRKFSEENSDEPWIIGAGYLRSAFDEIGPRKEWLDELESKRPIAITSKDGHSMWVNSKALEIAQITEDTPQPDEGVIKKDPETGQPSGLLQEPGAMNLVAQHMPEPPKEKVKESLLWLQDWLNAKGITTTHEAMLGLDEPNIYDAFNELAQEGKLTVRYRASWNISPDGDFMAQIQKGKDLANKFSHPHFKTHSFKFFADHVIEEVTGYLLEPYAHRDDGWVGIKVWEDDRLRDAFASVDSSGYQIHVHVIGDAAAKYTLDALQTLVDANGHRDSRHSFAHLQLARPEDIKRISDLGVSVHTSPYWMTIDDYHWELNLPYLGKERAFYKQYPFNSLFKAGANVTIASDFYVTEPDIMSAFYCGTTRQISQIAFDDSHAQHPNYRRISDPYKDLEYGDLGVLPPLEERASLENVIKAATLNGAYANFLDGDIGSIEVSKLADLVVLEKNLFDLDVEEIPTIRIALTIFEGKEVFRDSELIK
jgi:predicted amidohydrolase YtcJ